MVTAVGMLMLGCAIGVATRIKQSVIGATAVEVAEDLKADQGASQPSSFSLSVLFVWSPLSSS